MSFGQFSWSAAAFFFFPFYARTEWSEVNDHGLSGVSLLPFGHSGKQKEYLTD